MIESQITHETEESSWYNPLPKRPIYKIVICHIKQDEKDFSFSRYAISMVKTRSSSVKVFACAN